jgi:hypothetical protein
MPPGRGGRYRNLVIDELCYELRRIQSRMEAMKTTHRRKPDIGVVSESEDIGSEEILVANSGIPNSMVKGLQFDLCIMVWRLIYL